MPPLDVYASWTDLIRSDDPLTEQFERFRERFEAGEGMALVIEGEPPAPREAAAAIAAEIRDWPEVASLVAPGARVTPPGTLAADGRAAAVYLWMPYGADGSLEARRLMDRLATLDRPEGVSLRVAGSVIEEVEIARTVGEDLLLVIPATFLALVLVGWLVLRSAGAGLALATTIGTVLLLTMATHGLLYPKLTSITILVVPIVMAIVSANAVHFVARWRDDRRNHPPDEAMRRTVRRGGAACLLASFTTGAGFLALLVIGIPDFTRLAVLGAIGCAWSCIVVVGLMPILLERLDPDPVPVRAVLGRLTHAAHADLVGRGRVGPALVVGLLLIAAGAWRLSSTTRTLDLVPPHVDIHRAAPVLDRDLGGSCYVEVVWTSEADFRSDAGLARLGHAADRIREQVDGVLLVGSAAGAVAAAREVAPHADGRTLLAALEAGVGGPLPRYLDRSGHSARLTVRTPSTSSLALIDLAAATEATVRSVAAPGDQVAVVGAPLLIAHGIETVVTGQGLAALLSIALVSLIAAIVLRSWRALPVLWAANVLPLAALTGLLGWLGEPISISTAVVGSVVFGLIVDDTLHYLYALKETGNGPASAVRALDRLAPAFVATTLLLLAGALVSSVGRTPAVATFSRLMAVGVVLALLCDLFVAPRVAAMLSRPRGG